MAALTGPQRAAVVVSQLDEEHARVLLKEMTESEVIRLMAEVARLPPLRAQDVREVLTHFTHEAGAYAQVRQGGIEVARHWLTDRLGPQKAAEVLAGLEEIGTVAPFSFLNGAEPGQIAGFLAVEHPQVTAMVLAHVRQDVAARVLAALGEEQAAGIVERLATMTPVPIPLVRAIADVLENRLSAILRSGASYNEAGGVAAAARVLNNADGQEEKKILARIEDENPDLAEAIRAEMFVFDDVVNLEDVALQVVLRNVVLRDVALALKPMSQESVDKFLRNMSERAAGDLQEEMASLGPQRLSVVEAAKTNIVRVVRQLADDGEITLARSGDELVY